MKRRSYGAGIIGRVSKGNDTYRYGLVSRAFTIPGLPASYYMPPFLPSSRHPACTATKGRCMHVSYIDLCECHSAEPAYAQSESTQSPDSSTTHVEESGTRAAVLSPSHKRPPYTQRRHLVAPVFVIQKLALTTTISRNNTEHGCTICLHIAVQP